MTSRVVETGSYIELTTPLDKEVLKTLRAGDIVYISGTIYTARDAAHARMMKMIANGEPLPFDPEGQVIYYVGPCPAKPGDVIGSAGPTTSKRMDAYTPTMLEQGIAGMIGKGPRNSQVINSIKENGAVYFAAIGGAGALISKQIKAAEAIAFPELCAEAVYKLEVDKMFCVVAIDTLGNSQYKQGPAEYRKEGFMGIK